MGYLQALRSVASGEAPPVVMIAAGDEDEMGVKKAAVGRPKKEKVLCILPASIVSRQCYGILLGQMDIYDRGRRDKKWSHRNGFSHSDLTRNLDLPGKGGLEERTAR